MRWIGVLVTALVLSACAANPPANTTSPTAGQSLDCTKPATIVQQLVCHDRQLTSLDHRLSTAYQQALAHRRSAALEAAQSSWTMLHDACAQDTDPRTCVQEAYQTRLVQLAIADPATATPPVLTYRCPTQDGPLTAQFYNQFDPKTAVLNWKGDQVIVFVELSGSGARYGRQGIEYWEHQGEVRLDFHGATFVCRTS
ncbi:MliC family protein [Mycobacterium tuberculosis]